MRDIFHIKYVRYAIFLAIYIININSLNVFNARKLDAFMDADFDDFIKSIPGKALDIKDGAKMSDFYKFRGGILRIFSRNLQPTRPNAHKNHRKFYALSVRFTQLCLGYGYLGVSRKFSLNLLDLSSNLKVAYQPLLALPSW